jgi:hypothetical protein
VYIGLMDFINFYFVAVYFASSLAYEFYMEGMKATGCTKFSCITARSKIETQHF